MGGYGDPLDREPDAVLRDVHNGSVSPAMASALYGVVIADSSVDHAATTARRKEIRSSRLASMRHGGHSMRRVHAFAGTAR
jgi:N-methylhydantoinase B